MSTFTTQSTLLLLVACLGSSPLMTGDRPPARCKYSVRDVAFVNVHGKPWQLRLIKPKNIDADEFRSWNLGLKNKLANSNLGFIWHQEDSEAGQKLLAQSNQADLANSRNQKLPLCVIGHAGMEPMSITMDQSLSLSENLANVTSSPARSKLLEHVVDSLCVFVIVESGDPEADRVALQTVKGSIDQVNKQLWTLEKPANEGPAFVSVNSLDKREQIFLQSIGISGQVTSPTVAVIYGQGRRLGGLITGNELTIEKLVGRASICGQDCECELNRDWLYAAQMIHDWPKDLERLAEASLNFDPHSAFVVAEVAQILRKTGGKPVNEDTIDLGGGLIIHSFDDDPNLEAPSDSESMAPRQSSSAFNKPTNDTDDNSVAEPDVDGSPLLEPMEPGSTNRFPWILITSLLAITITIWLIKLKANNR